MKIRFIVFLLMLASFISCEPIAQEIKGISIVGEHVFFLEPERTVEIIFYEDPSLGVPADTLVMSKDNSQRIFPKEFMPLSFSVKKNFLAFMVATQDADVVEVVFHEQNDIRRWIKIPQEAFIYDWSTFLIGVHTRPHGNKYYTAWEGEKSITILPHMIKEVYISEVVGDWAKLEVKKSGFDALNDSIFNLYIPWRIDGKLQLIDLTP